MSENKKVKDVLKKKPWPPETKPKPKEIGKPKESGQSPKMADKLGKVGDRTDEPVIKAGNVKNVYISNSK